MEKHLRRGRDAPCRCFLQVRQESSLGLVPVDFRLLGGVQRAFPEGCLLAVQTQIQCGLRPLRQPGRAGTVQLAAARRPHRPRELRGERRHQFRPAAQRQSGPQMGGAVIGQCRYGSELLEQPDRVHGGVLLLAHPRHAVRVPGERSALRVQLPDGEPGPDVQQRSGVRPGRHPVPGQGHPAEPEHEPVLPAQPAHLPVRRMAGRVSGSA